MTTPERHPEPQVEQQQVQQQQHQEPLEDLLANEYSEELDFVKKKLPKIYNIQTSPNPMIRNKKIEISDIFYRAPDSEEIVGTSAIVILHPHIDHSQIRPWKIDTPGGRIRYTVLAGRGSISIQDLSKPIRKGDSFYIESGVRHTVVNNIEPDDPKAEDLRIIIEYAGFFDFRDLYKIYSQGVKKSQESMKHLYKQAEVPTQTKIPKPPKAKSDQTFI